MAPTTNSSLPANVHISSHPCIKAKISQLRGEINAREFKSLIHEISHLVAYEAFASVFQTVSEGEAKAPLNDTFTIQTVSPHHISIVPILRSGLGMIDAISSLLPFPDIPIHHLGLYRSSTLSTVEYYNNLSDRADPVQLAIIADPIIATGATCAAAIGELKKYGAKRIVLLAVLCSEAGVRRLAADYADVEFFVGGMDPKTDEMGMIRPGIGDVGDRLFCTKSK